MYDRQNGLNEDDTIFSVYLRDVKRALSGGRDSEKENECDGLTSTGRKPVYNGGVSKLPKPQTPRPSDGNSK